ncbi:MAG: thiamine diphosphokinase [Thermaceae bacterium]
MRLALLLGGPLLLTEELKRRLEAYPLWAADSGARHALLLGRSLERWLGDFDSGKNLPLEALKELLPQDKDLTDGEALLQKALEKGAKEVLLLGSLGGRLDHTLAHLLLALKVAHMGVRVELTNGLETLHPLLPGRHRFPLAPGTLFSLLPFPSMRLSLSGGQWELQGEWLEGTRGLENRVLTEVEVEVLEGKGFLYWTG